MDINKLMKQAQKMQDEISKVQDGLDDIEVEGGAGAGMVKIVVTGKGTAKSVKIDPSILDDVEMLEDLMVAAINDAKEKTEAHMSDVMGDATSSMGLPPGMKLPF